MPTELQNSNHISSQPRALKVQSEEVGSGEYQPTAGIAVKIRLNLSDVGSTAIRRRQKNSHTSPQPLYIQRPLAREEISRKVPFYSKQGKLFILKKSSQNTSLMPGNMLVQLFLHKQEKS